MVTLAHAPRALELDHVETQFFVEGSGIGLIHVLVEADDHEVGVLDGGVQAVQ